MTGYSEKSCQRFERDEYKILIVADKYQQIDQPYCNTMYVDKNLSELKRSKRFPINRMHPVRKYFRFGFCNDRQTILDSF